MAPTARLLLLAQLGVSTSFPLSFEGSLERLELHTAPQPLAAGSGAGSSEDLPSLLDRGGHERHTERGATTSAEEAGLSELLVVRISSVARAFNWLEPHRPGPESQAQPFTGFGVYLAEAGSDDAFPGEEEFNRDPVFVTTNKVGADSRLSLEFPRMSRDQFEAYVSMDYPRFKLALVKLKDPSAFARAFQDACSREERGGCSLFRLALPARKVAVRSEAMEMVAAMGYPAEPSGLKVTTGYLTGVETVDGAVCYQQQAPLQTGGAGGPLVNASGASLLYGMNIAVATQESAQNIGYVIPVAHIRQLLLAYRGRAAECSLGPRGDSPRALERCRLRTAPVHRFIAAEPNDVMYSVSGCPGGVFISKMTAMSGLRGVEAGDYILEVDGRRLDRFGTATCDEISGENIRFDLLISLDERIVRDDASVALKICRPSEQGEPSMLKLSIPMRWEDEKHRMRIDTVLSPFIEYQDIRQHYEIFGGMTFMQLTVNHIEQLLGAGVLLIGEYAVDDQRTTDRVVIVKVDPASEVRDFMGAGMIVASVNGARVQSLADFRNHFQPKDSSITTWELVTETHEKVVLNFDDVVLQQARASRRSVMGKPQDDLLTDAVLHACRASPQCQSVIANSEVLQGAEALVAQHLTEGHRRIARHMPPS